MAQTGLRISGFGGQGVILAGYVVGKAAALYDHRYATLVQSYGPEARGSACSAQVIISDEPIHYPYLTGSDILIAMSQEAYTSFAGEVVPGGVLLLDEDLVVGETVRPDVRLFRIPATRLAEEIGHRIVANVVMLGSLTALAPVTTVKAMMQALASSFPPTVLAVNQKAFELGYESARALPLARAVADESAAESFPQFLTEEV
jgi:2-oxoglutarate ferredoxin oxidoreductase subunit gamma